jgi:hypothetical protein
VRGGGGVGSAGIGYGKAKPDGVCHTSAPTDWCAAEAAFMWAPTRTWPALLRTHTALPSWNRLKAACARCTICVVPQHALRSDLGRHSQRHCASRRPLRHPTARLAMARHGCRPFSAAVVPTTVTQPAAASLHAMRSYLQCCGRRCCTSQRPLRQSTAHNTIHPHDCSQKRAAFVSTTVTQPAAALHHATRSGL